MRWLAAAALGLFLGCGDGGDRVVVGSKNFTEQRILGELLAQTADSVGLKVQRRLDLGGTFVCDAAIRAGQIDMYVEYTGTALTAILKEQPGASPPEVLARVRASYAPLGLTWTAPFGFDNTFALVIRGDAAAKQNLATITDLTRVAPRWRAGFGYEFSERADGFPGLARTYGLQFKETRIMDLGLLYRALAEKKVDVVAGNATDGVIRHIQAVVLKDDKAYFPPYEAAPVVRQATLDKYPALGPALEALGGKLSAEAMRLLNYEVDGEHRDPPTVVTEFRRSAGLTRRQ